MEYRKLGKSNISVSVITFGAWAIGGWMWGGTDEEEAIKAIKKGFDLGVTTIDTAPVYGFGLSEEIVGKAIKGNRHKVQILTKYGLLWDTIKGTFYFKTENNSGEDINLYKYSGKDSIIKECELSLKRLGTDYIDLYQIHWPDPVTPIEKTMEAVNKLIKEGKILAAGVCNYPVEDIKIANEIIPIASNQIPYSMINRINEKEIFPYCRENNIGILAYSPLQRGVLTGKIGIDHEFKESDNRRNSPYYKMENREKILDLLGKLYPIATINNMTLSQLVINWTIQQPGVTSALVGARNISQIEENGKAADFKLNDADINLIKSYIDILKLDLR